MCVCVCNGEQQQFCAASCELRVYITFNAVVWCMCSVPLVVYLVRSGLLCAHGAMMFCWIALGRMAQSCVPCAFDAVWCSRSWCSGGALPRALSFACLAPHYTAENG